MRALVAAVTGLALALALVFALVFAITAWGPPAGGTSPKPLLTTVPAHP